MATDKSLRQHYNDIGFSKVEPSKDGSRPGYFTALYGGAGASRSGDGSHDRGGGQHAAQAAAAQRAAAQRAADAAAERERTITSPHADTPFQLEEQKVADELNRQKEIRDLITQQQEEKFGPTADPTKFGETVEDLTFKSHPEYKEQEAKRAIKQLSTEAGTKEALREFQALKTGRQYVPDFGLLEKLGIKKPEGILRSLVDTGQKFFDPKKMAFNLARNYGMKKIGLGAVVPWLGLLSFLPQLFGQKGMFASKPKDMSAFNKLELFNKRFPTQTADIPQRVGQDTTAKKIATGEVDLNKLITGGKQDTSGIEGHQAKLVGLALAQKQILEKKKEMEQRNKDLEIEGPEFTPTDQKFLDKLIEMDKEEKIYRKPILTAAHGGFIDGPLMGRNRDI